MKVYLDQNVWQHLYQSYPIDDFKKTAISKNIEIYLGITNIYEFGRLSLNEKNDEKIKKIFFYLWELIDILKFIKEPNPLLLDDLEYARTGGKPLIFLDDHNTASVKQEIYRISQGNYAEGKKFIKTKEENIKKDSPYFIKKVKTINQPPEKDLIYENFRDSWGMRRELLNNSTYKNQTRYLSDRLLFSEPQKYPFINTWINSQLYINFVVLAKKAIPINYTSDFRHLICSNTAGNFVTMDKRLINSGGNICPYIRIMNWEIFEKTIND